MKWVCLFGEIEKDKMRLNSYGEIIRLSWFALPQHYTNVELDVFVIMPNHIYGIIFLTDLGAGFKPVPADSRSDTRHGLPIHHKMTNKPLIDNCGELLRLSGKLDT